MNTMRIMSCSIVGLHQALALRRHSGIAGYAVLFRCLQVNAPIAMMMIIDMARVDVCTRVDRLSVINPMAGSADSPPMPMRSIGGLFVPCFFSNLGKFLIMIKPNSEGMAATMNDHLQLLIA